MGGRSSKSTKNRVKNAKEEPKTKNENDYWRSLPDLRSRRIVVALYKYEARQSDDLAFKRGDKMEIIETNGDWLLAKNIVTGNVGYIPNNYVTEDSNIIEKQDWWFGGDRRDADKQLMLQGNPRGTFLVRNAADKKSYALSIRDFVESLNDVVIRHYRIKVNDLMEVYITPTKTFPSLVELVESYKTCADGLCSRLIKACPKEPACIPFRELEVKRKEIQLITRLGQGQFGEVWKGKWRKQVDVAVKTLKMGAMSVDDFIGEAKMMHKIRHHRLVQIMGVCTDQMPIYIITELMPNGCLLDYLRNDDGRTVRLSNLIDMATDITEGLEYLEKNNIVHRDIRAANILVGANLSCKVADFGLAKILDREGIYDTNENAKFPIKWTAPEAAIKKTFSSKSDVWSFGILMYEMITYGRTPYPGMDNMRSLEEVNRGYRIPRPVNCGCNANLDCPLPVYDIMLQCWHKSPERRPTFEYLNRFFANYNSESERQYC